MAVRDAAQLDLLEKLRGRLGAGLGWKTEVLVGDYGDLRAWDAVIIGPTTVGIDAETRLRDIQALQRRTEAKWRDSAVHQVVLLVAATRHNRAVLREYRHALVSTFPLSSEAVMHELQAGRIPQANGIVLL